MDSTTTGKFAALVAGGLAATGALVILLQDAIRTNEWQLEHGLIPVLMAVQILTAHSVVNALRSRCWGSALGFAVVATVATWGVLYTSVGKQTTIAAEASAIAGDVNELRADLKKRLAANQEMLDGARAKMAAECASGRGKRCVGLEATVKVYEDAVAGNLAALNKAGHTKPVGANADKMAELLSLLTGYGRDAIKHMLLLLEPFTYATIFELAALVSFGFAFSPKRRTVAKDASEADRAQTSFPEIEASEVAEALEAFGPDVSKGPKNGGVSTPKRPHPPTPKGPNGSKRSMDRDEILSDLMLRAATGRSFDSQEQAANHYGVSPSRFSEWSKEWVANGSVQLRTVGRRKVMKFA